MLTSYLLARGSGECGVIRRISINKINVACIIKKRILCIVQIKVLCTRFLVYLRGEFQKGVLSIIRRQIYV